MEKSAVGNQAYRRLLNILLDGDMAFWNIERSNYKNLIGQIHDRIHNRNIFEKAEDFLAGYSKTLPSLRHIAAKRLGILGKTLGSQRRQNKLLDINQNRLMDAYAAKSQTDGSFRKILQDDSIEFPKATAKPYAKQVTPWWGENPASAEEAYKNWNNLPKYLRNAYEAGHTVTPAKVYHMRDIAPGINKTVF